MKAYVMMWSEAVGYDCDCQTYGVTLDPEIAKWWADAHYNHWSKEVELYEGSKRKGKGKKIPTVGSPEDWWTAKHRGG